MIYDKINLMLPSYHRVPLLSRFIDSARDNAIDPQKNVVFTICANAEDEETISFVKNLGGNASLVIESTRSPDLPHYYNKMYEETCHKQDSYIVSMVGDDMLFRTKKWDEILLHEINSFNGIGIWYGDDCCGTDGKMAVQLFMTRKYVNAIKPLPWMCPIFPVNDIDAVWFNTASRLGHAHYLPQLKIQHVHASSDATAARLIGRYAEAESARDGAIRGNLKYESQCIANIQSNLANELAPNLGVMLTTYDRIDLLKRTIASYCMSEIVPSTLHVFDDGSINIQDVINIIDAIPGVIFHPTDRHAGIYSSTPLVLKAMFEEYKHDAVLILDSDTLFSRHWWMRAIAAYNAFSGDDNAMSVSLFNYTGCSATPSMRPCYYERKVNGAFGCIIKKKYFENFILPLEHSPAGYTNWDNHAAEDSAKAGYKHYSTIGSYLQHTGLYDGEHVGTTQTETYATDFAGCIFPDTKDAIDESVDRQNVLVCCLARAGDCINASLIVNYLRENTDFKVTFLTLQMYYELCECIMPGVDMIMLREGSDCEWAHMSTMEMRRQYPGYRYYLNLQPGSPEHHSALIGSGKSIHQYTIEYSNKVLHAKIPDNCFEYRRLSSRKVDPIDSQGKKICLMSCDVASPIKVPFSEKTARARAIKLNDDGWFARILKKDKPDGPFRDVRALYYWGRKLCQIPYLMQQCDLFIGNDSGLAWCSIFSNGQKEIHHSAERIAETNNRFSLFDGSFNDIIE